MTFRWPWMLLTLLLLPVLVVAYRRLLARRDRRRAELAAQGLVASGAAPGRRRHVGPVLLLAALGLLLLGLARPEATVGIPTREGTVILAFDASNSMKATDLKPSRMDAAKAAARAFVRRQPSTIRIGVVAFSDSGLVTLRPTTSQTDVLQAIDRITPQGGTALGRGIQSALSAIAGKPVVLDDPGEGDTGTTLPPPDIGYFGSAAIVLLTDGENTAPPEPQAVAEQTAVAGVKIYPIGLGTTAGTVLTLDGFQISTRLDEAALKRIASTTDGTYFAAADESELAKVYGTIDLAWTTEPQRTEITALAAGAGALLLLIGAGLSLLRYGRVV